MDLRKPGEEEDEYSEMAEEAMDPENCFPDSKCEIIAPTHARHNRCASQKLRKKSGKRRSTHLHK